MIYLKLDATDSTNSFLRELVREGSAVNWTVVSADCQSHGRGQRGAAWFSDKGKNLTFSILISDCQIEATDQFILNFTVSAAIYKVFDRLGVPQLKVKWPNDIMSGSSKLAGILIENSIMGDRVQHSIVGIGVNVNQEEFPPGLPMAVSLLQLLDRPCDLDSLLKDLAEAVRKEFKGLKEGRREELKCDYEKYLFRRNEEHVYRIPGGDPFVGRIMGVSEQGKLQVQKENGSVADYAFKEIEYL